MRDKPFGGKMDLNTIKPSNCIYDASVFFLYSGGNVVFVSSVAGYQPMQASERTSRTIILNIFI